MTKLYVLSLLGVVGYVVLAFHVNRFIARGLRDGSRCETAMQLAYGGPQIEELVAGADPELIADELRLEARDRH